jgi:hypothetical protein
LHGDIAGLEGCGKPSERTHLEVTPCQLQPNIIDTTSVDHIQTGSPPGFAPETS